MIIIAITLIWLGFAISTSRKHPDPSTELITYIQKLQKQTQTLQRLSYLIPVFMLLSLNLVVEINIFQTTDIFLQGFIMPIACIFIIFFFRKIILTRTKGYQTKAIQAKCAGTQQDLDKVKRIVAKIANKAKMSVPACFIVENVYVSQFETLENAASTSNGKKEEAIIIDANFLSTLSMETLYGVLAHEVSHLKSNDFASIINLISLGYTLKFIFVFGIIFYSSLLTNAGYAFSSFFSIVGFSFFGLYIFWMIIFALFKMAISRKEEYAADACGVYLVGKQPMLALLSMIHQQEEKSLKEATKGSKEKSQKMKRLQNQIGSHPSSDLRASVVLQLDYPDTLPDMPID